MPLISTKATASAFGVGWTSPSFDTSESIRLLTPASISYSGTSASISNAGSVEFSGCTTLSLNGVISSTYKSYMISITHTLAAGDQVLNFRFRSNGTDLSAASYRYLQTLADSTTITGPSSGTSWATQINLCNSSNTLASGTEARVSFHGLYDVHVRARNASGKNNMIHDSMGGVFNREINNQGVVDGFTIYPAGSSIAGRIAVYGLVL